MRVTKEKINMLSNHSVSHQKIIKNQTDPEEETFFSIKCKNYKVSKNIL